MSISKVFETVNHFLGSRNVVEVVGEFAIDNLVLDGVSLGSISAGVVGVFGVAIHDAFDAIVVFEGFSVDRAVIESVLRVSGEGGLETFVAELGVVASNHFAASGFGDEVVSRITVAKVLRQDGLVLARVRVDL